MSPRTTRVLAGALLIFAGLVLAIEPRLARDALGRHPVTPSDWMNLRASFGGTLLGLGAALAWLPSVRPWRRAGLGLLGWAMAGIGAARLLGFFLDGSPDVRQWVWLIAEGLIVVLCVVLLRRGRAPAARA